MEILNYGKSVTNTNDWRVTAILGYCRSHINCRSCSLKAFCRGRKKTLTELTLTEQREALHQIVKEDF